MKRITSALFAALSSLGTTRRHPRSTFNIQLSTLAVAALFAATASADLPRPDPSIAEFARGVKFTVAGYNGGAEVQTNFPVLVRLSTAITGFDYGDFYNDGSLDINLVDIGFVDADGNGIPYEIDTWNPANNATSLVWVTLPVMTNGTEFAMWYRSSKTGKALNSTNAWFEYTGVWHLNESGAKESKTAISDSTTNALHGTSQDCAASVSVGRIGGSWRLGDDYNRIKGGIVIDFAADATKNATVNDLGDTFSTSFWMKRRDKETKWCVTGLNRRQDGSTAGWGTQMHDDNAQLRVYGNGGKNTYTASSTMTGSNTADKWGKVDVVWFNDNGVGKFVAYWNGAPVTTANLNPATPVSQPNGVNLVIGNFQNLTSDRVWSGEMDEVRLIKGRPSAVRIVADYETVNTPGFLTADTVFTNQVIERPVANIHIADKGASHIQFGGSLSSIGGEGATKCEFLAKVWPSAEAEPAVWTRFASNLTAGAALSGITKGLVPETEYSYRLKVTNDDGDGIDSDEETGSFTTAGVAIGGIGGDVTRIGDDWLHYFRVAVDEETGAVTNAYVFTPPAYASVVRALVVGGGGPGGYYAGGGGGAGGLIYNTALTVTPGADYAINVGTGGVASASANAYGFNGGDSSVVGTGVNIVAVGGGAGGNGKHNNQTEKLAGVDGGSGGGSAWALYAAGSGTAGQGNAGGTVPDGQFQQNLAAGGGGAVAVGGSVEYSGNDTAKGTGAGGSGLTCDITGESLYYAGGGGGGGRLYSTNLGTGTAGSGGNGGGGTGGQYNNAEGSQFASDGVDGFGGGGGGGSNYNVASYKGGDGGDGIVIVRYPAQGNGSTVAEPIISLQSATCNDTTFRGEVTFRVAWAGYGYETANVKVAWGYSKNSLVHTTDIIATNVIGIASGSFPLVADKCNVYCRAIAVNGAELSSESTETLSFYVAENEQAQEETSVPVLSSVGLDRYDAIYAVVTGVVVSAGSSNSDPATCTVRVNIGSTENNLAEWTTETEGVGPFAINVTNLAEATTYWYNVEAVDDVGTVAETEAESFTTFVTKSVLAEPTHTTARRIHTIAGSLMAVGTGTTHIFVKWGDGAWTEIGAFNALSDSTEFSSSYTGTWDASIYGYLMCSNECRLVDGSLAEAPYVTTRSWNFSPIDNTTYTWRPVNGDWSGDWSDPNHWASNNADCRGYPNDSSCVASFLNCTLANPVTVNIDGKYTANKINLFDGDAANLSFIGSGATTSSLTTSSEIGFTIVNSEGYMPSNSSVLFKDMALTSSGQQLNFANNKNNAETGLSVEFSGATVNAKTIWLRANDSSISFRDGTTVTLTEKMSVGGTNTVVTIDNSTITTPSVYAGDNRDSTGLKLRFEGSSPLLDVANAFQTYNRADMVAIEFAVPTGGFSTAPINKKGSAFATAIAGQTPGYFTFAVAADSPALTTSAASFENMVLVQTVSGFATDKIGAFTVPEHDGVPYGEFKWGVGGAPLAEGADVTTARQILLDLTGVEPYVALTIPAPLPENVTLVSVTTNGFAVDAAEGVYTVLNGATVAITFAPAEDYALVGSETVEVVMDGDTTLSSDLIPTAVSIRPVTLTIPELPSNVTIASVTTNGIAITPAEGVYTVINGASVVVAFEAASGYVLTGALTTATVAMDGDVTLPSASIPTAITLRAAISINEIMASNPSLDKGGIANGKGIAEMDWVEFHNASAEDIDITGWFLSDNDKKGKETKATILGHCVVPAGGYEIVWLDKTHIDPAEYAENEGFAILKLSSSGDLIQLADATTNVVDKINFKDKPQIKGYSYGPGTVSYGPYAGTGPYVYMKTATPRAENVTEGWGDFTPTVYFSVPHGWKTESFNLELVCSNAPSADIYYTLDGTSPTTASTLYSGPIAISGTTIVRAAVPVVGSILQFDTSATYIYLDQVLAQGRTTTAPAGTVGFPNSLAVNSQKMLYGMLQLTGEDRERMLVGFTNSIPTISIVTDPGNLFNGSTGVYVNAKGEGVEWERQIMLEQFDPTGVGADFAQPAGIRIRGGNSRQSGWAKHAIRLFFRSSYGESSLAQKMFPGEKLTLNGEGKMKEEIGEYDKLDLRCSQNLSWANASSTMDTFVTEVFARDSQRDMGQPYTRSRYVHLFLNGQYWGLYQTQERADEHFGEAYLGGDSLQYDVIKAASSWSTGKLAYSIECNEGTWDAWTNLFNIAINEGFGGEYTNNYYKVLGLNPDGTRNPNYPILLNPGSLMSFMFSTHFMVDQDGPTSPFSGIDKGHPNNFNAIRNRDDAGTVSGFVFLRHDAEVSMAVGGGNTVASANPTYWGTENQTSPSVPVGGTYDPSGLGKLKFRTVPYFTPAELHYLLMQNPTYKREYADAFYKHFLRPGGAMTMEKNIERYTSRMAEIDDAIVCEQARWAQSGQTRTTWLSACGTSLDFITNRVDNMKSQYVAAGWYPSIDAPSATNALGQVFADGDKIEPEDTVYFSGTESGTIYYTTNGIDPRAVDGAVAEGAIAYDPATGAAMPETGALVKARILTDGGEWSALEEVEIDVNLPSDQKLGIRIAAIMSVPKNDPDGEFIILTNILDRAVSLQGLTVKAEKSTKTPTTLFTITDNIELAAGASIKLKRADYWSSNDDLKLKNNDIIVVIRDLNDKLVQTAIVKADTWFLTTKLDDKGKPIGACKGLGSYFIALEFGEEVVREDQWKASPLPPKPTVFMAF